MPPSTAATVLQHLSTVRVYVPYAVFQAESLTGRPISIWSLKDTGSSLLVAQPPLVE